MPKRAREDTDEASEHFSAAKAASSIINIGDAAVVVYSYLTPVYQARLRSACTFFVGKFNDAVNLNAFLPVAMSDSEVHHESQMAPHRWFPVCRVSKTLVKKLAQLHRKGPPADGSGMTLVFHLEIMPRHCTIGAGKFKLPFPEKIFELPETRSRITSVIIHGSCLSSFPPSMFLPPLPNLRHLILLDFQCITSLPVLPLPGCYPTKGLRIVPFMVSLVSVDGVVRYAKRMLEHEEMNCRRQLTDVDLTAYPALKDVGKHFLARTSLTSVDLSNTTIANIGDGFLAENSHLHRVHLPTTLTCMAIPSDFLRSTSITHVDLTLLRSTSLGTIGDSFLASTLLVQSPNFSPLASISTIGDKFLAGCVHLKAVDLTAFTNVQKIGSFFIADTESLTDVDLTPFLSVKKVGNYFLSQSGAFQKVMKRYSSRGAPTAPSPGIDNALKEAIEAFKALGKRWKEKREDGY